LKWNFFTFNENNGISAFNKNALKMLNRIRPMGFKSKVLIKFSFAKTDGKLVISNALAGVGSPMNEFV
jgi:hypothetical protein